MRNAEQQDDQAPAPGPIAAAVAASANGLKGRDLDLESALTDASLFGRLAYHAFCDLGFVKLEPPQLDQDENALVYWAISRLSFMVDEAKAAFYEEHDRKRASS